MNKKNKNLITQTVVPNKNKIVFKKRKIKIIGIGGGGSSIILEIAKKISKISFSVVDTDSQILKKAKQQKISCLQLGQDLTHGFGTGMDLELAETASIKEKEKIKKFLQGYDLCILISCLGGGTGSGVSPVFAKIANNLGIMTLGIFTLPFKFEGERKIEIAKESFQKLKPNLNAICVLPNEKIFQIIDKNTPLKEALSIINRNLINNLEGLIETIYSSGIINIDFADLKTILEGKGKLFFLNSVVLEKSKEGTENFKTVLSNPFYFYTIKGAKAILFNITGEGKNILLSDISQISKLISELIDHDAKIIFGIYQNKSYQNKIRITIFGVGCSYKIFPEETKKLEKDMKTKMNKEIKEQKNKKTKKIKTNSQKIKIVDDERKNKKDNINVQIRKNSLQIRKELEEQEKELLEKEKIWEVPPSLR